MSQSLRDVFGPVIYSYTRAQAIDDGVLVDVSEVAREVGIVFPTVVTAGVWAEYVAVPPEAEGTGQSESGRLWDVLWMFYLEARRLKGPTPTTGITFKLHVCQDARGGFPAPLFSLKAVCGPGDNAEPVITIMLPNED